MNIIEFIEDPRFIGDKTLSPAQKMSLKAVYGEPLTKEEKRLFRKCTGLRRYHEGREYPEVTYILGRASGKSSKLANYLSIWEAFRKKVNLAPGERAVVMVVASEIKRQAQVTFRFIRDTLKKSPLLNEMIVKVLSDEIVLNNGVSIQVFPCSQAKIRGQSILTFIGDEVAHWKSADELQDVDEDVITAARFGLRWPNSKMIKISSPWTTMGEIYKDYDKYFGKSNKNCLVMKGDTVLFNPTFKKQAEALKKRDPLKYRTEILAEFRDYEGNTMYDPKVIQKAIDDKRPDRLAFEEGNRYLAFFDAAGGSGKDSFTLAVGHTENKGSPEEKFVIDLVEERKPPFNPAHVVSDFSAIINEYVDTDRTRSSFDVMGDRFSWGFASNEFMRHGVGCDQSPLTKSDLYLRAETFFNQYKVSLPNDKKLLEQLKSLVRLPRSGGREAVDSPGGKPEDKANVVAGVLWLLDNPPYMITDGEVHIV